MIPMRDPAQKSSLSRHWILTAVLAAVAIVYMRLPATGFCGFDDMIELHRIEYLDGPTVWSDFTVPFANSYKYRPLSLIFNRITYEYGRGSASVFRTRNLLCHLFNVALLYGIGWLLFRSRLVAATAALLFGIHPLTNQGVVGGLWTVTPCGSLLFLSVFLFLVSIKSSSVALLFASMLAATAGVFAYDAVLAVFAIPYAYLALGYLFERRIPDRRYAAILVILTMLGAGSYFYMRRMYLPPGSPKPVGLTAIAKNVAMYASTPFILLDPVMANEWFDTPMPSEIRQSREAATFWAVAVGAPIVLLLLWVALSVRKLRERLKTLEWPAICFILISAAACLSPFLFFNDHASETYIYYPMAFFMLLLSRVLAAVLQAGESPNLPYVIVVSVLVLLFAPATWIRNSRVARCGSTVSRILSAIPNQLREGTWKVLVAPVPYEAQSSPYGMYGYRGLDTLAFGSYGSVGLQSGLEYTLHNRQVQAQAVSPEQMQRLCRSHLSGGEACLWVHSDGQISTGPGRPEPRENRPQ